MNYILENMVLRQLGTYAYLFGGFILILSALYLLPIVQALYAYSKKRWLEKQFAATPSSGEAENKFRQHLLDASEPSQAYPIYKIFKFYFATIGIVAMIIGFLMVALPDDLGPDALDWMLYIPLIIGAGLYFLYQAAFPGQGLYREIASVFAFLGFTVTALIAFVHHDMNEWLRTDILAFIILGVGGLIIWHSRSILTSYLYMIFVAIAGATVYIDIEDNWLYFLPHLLWVFGIAILYIWIPKLKETKDIGPKEIIFGIIFTMMILSLTMTQLSAGSGLLIPAMAVVLPGLYIFSKTYYYKADTIIGKPIDIIIVSIIVFTGMTLTTNIGMTNASDSIFLFEEYSFEKQVSYFILLGLIGGIFWLFNKDYNDSTEDINPLIALFPVVVFIVAYILGEYTGHYIVTLLLLGIGFLYVRKGIDIKDSIRVALGTVIFIYTLIVKMNDIWSEDLYDSKNSTGLTIIIYGAIFLGAVIYIRSQWLVTGPSNTSKANDNGDVLDHIDKSQSNDNPE